MNAAPSAKPEFIAKQVIEGRYLFLDLNAKTPEAPIVNCIGHEVCNADYSLDRRKFHYHAIEIIHTGKWLLKTKNQAYELGPGSAFSYDPRSRFHMETAGDGPWAKYFVDFSAPHASELLQQAKLPPLLPKSVNALDRFIDLFDRALDGANYPQKTLKELSYHYLHLLLIELSQHTVAFSTKELSSLHTYRDCRQYLNTNYRELHSVAEWSEACGLSQEYLTRLFQKYAGESPGKALTRLKMEHAARRLRVDQLSVKQAGGEVGYADPYHFSRVFKKTYGIAPNHYK